MAVTVRRRRARAEASGSVSDLERLVDQLIKENRDLKKKVAKLEAAGATITRGRKPGDPTEKLITQMKRKLERAVTATTSGRRTRAAAAAPVRTRRPVSPEVAERRRAALAKARAVRAEKRAAAAAAAAG